MVSWSDDEIAFYCASFRKAQGFELMLKITKTQEKTTTILKLEGRLAGLWVHECSEAWKALIPDLQGRKLCVDIRDVTFVDQSGEQLLAEMYKQHDVRFLTGSLLTRHFADKAIQTSTHLAPPE